MPGNREYQRRWVAERPGYNARKRFDRLVKAAGRAPDLGCEICGAPFQMDGRWTSRPIFDHDHVTGDFRGWLCNACNVGLGRFKDNPEVLRKAADYLEDK